MSDKEINDLNDRCEWFSLLQYADRNGMQTLLRHFSAEEFAIALKYSNDKAVRKKVFENLSNRASEYLQNTMQKIGAIDAAEAQETIDRIMKKS